MNAKTIRSQAVSSFSMDDFTQALESHDYQFQSGQVVRGRVIELDSNGAFIDIGGKSLAFLPQREAALKPIAELSELLPPKSEAEFLIISEQNSDGQVTLSRRRLQLKQVWQTLAEQQAEGKTLSVRVIGINKGGVIVDVEGLRGFIPRSHLTERENLQGLVGQTLTVGFVEVNPETNKLVLSQKMVAQVASISHFAVGQLVEGEITGIKPFGLFINLNGSTGLLHIKEISQNYIASLPALFKIGQPIKAVVASLDEMKGRIALSTKVLEKSPGEMIEQMATVMAEAEERLPKIKGKIEG
ncbi:MAG: S1 RNA-binding domain-containing protein [Cyanobacteriota bacterium]|nr:S1 RNA-binding domain-containing protein [Cyanobacteriota bacterium]